MTDIWFVRAGRDSIYAEDFIQKDVVGIGWEELGELEKEITKTKLMELYKKHYPDHADGRAQVSVSQVLRFSKDIKVGNEIMTYDRDQQLYYLGQIMSDCQPGLIPELPRIRSVEWKYQIPRNVLSSEAKNTLGAIQTLFLVKGKVAGELRTKSQALLQYKLDHVEPVSNVQSSFQPEQIELAREIRTELLEKSEQAIEDRIVLLGWEQVQELVAGILRAMGYRTTISPRGSDRGVDIFASPDGLGLEEPRIFVEVKHRPTTSMGAQDIRSFLGGRSADSKCLYVSTGGFTKDARYEADRANIAITLIGLVDLRKLLVDYYEQLDEEIKSMIPLKRIYVLAD
jgi:restriction system protein